MSVSSSLSDRLRVLQLSMRREPGELVLNRLAELEMEVERESSQLQHPQDELLLFRAESYRLRTGIYINLGRLEDAESELSRLAELHRESESSVVRAYECSAHGRLLAAKQRYSEALACYSEASEKFAQGAYWFQSAAALYDIANLRCERMQDYTGALEIFVQLQDVFRDHPESASLRSSAAIALHTVYVRLEEFDNAARTLLAVEAEIRESDDQRLLLVWLINYSSVLERLQRFEEQLSVLIEAAQRADAMQATNYQPTVQIALGLAYHNLGRLAEAKECYEAVIRYSAHIDAPDRLAHAHLQLAILCAGEHLPTDDFAGAERHFKMAVDVAHAAGITHMESVLVQGFAEFYKECGRFEEALLLQEQALELQSHIFSADKARRLAELQDGYEQKLQLQQTKILELEKHRLREHAEYLEKQLSMKTQGMLEQLKALQTLKNNIYESTRQLNTAEAILRQVRSILNASPLMREDWDSFLQTFSQVHPSFTRELLERFPDLTKMEIRICMLLKAQLNSEQIADLLSLSVRNIENHRYRMRKKLGLERGQSLESALVF